MDFFNTLSSDDKKIRFLMEQLASRVFKKQLEKDKKIVDKHFADIMKTKTYNWIFIKESKFYLKSEDEILYLIKLEKLGDDIRWAKQAGITL